MRKSNNNYISKRSEDADTEAEKIKGLLKSKKAAAALCAAVIFTIGCTAVAITMNQDDDDDDSYYIGHSGGGYYNSYYYYKSDATYRSGSWSKILRPSSEHGYSSGRGGSIGG